MTKLEMIAWLEECSKYFSNRPTNGEDSIHWSNVYNSENAKKIAEYLKQQNSLFVSNQPHHPR